MPITKNAMIRYKVIDKCLSNQYREYSFEDLQNEIHKALMEINPKSKGISIKTLRNDLKFMRSPEGFDAPINSFKGDDRKYYYCYSEKDYSINNSPLNSHESELLGNALKMLERFKGNPAFDWINEITPIMQDKFGLKGDNHVIRLESNEDYTGSKYIPELMDAIFNKRNLCINYQPFDKEEEEHIISPYYLRQYNSRWFLFGKSNKYEDNPFSNFALDRINDSKESSSKYIPYDINWEEYFDDIIGVSYPKNGKLEEIKLWFPKKQAPYILTKPFHSSQKEYRQEDGSLEIKVNLVLNYELEMKILGFGESIKVLSPQHLVDKIHRRLKSASEAYEKI